jgi:hypothetical protein
MTLNQLYALKPGDRVVAFRLRIKCIVERVVVKFNPDFYNRPYAIIMPSIGPDRYFAYAHQLEKERE